MNAPTLFDAPETQGRSRKSDPQTSVDAAKTVKVGSQRHRLLSEMRHGPVTADYMAAIYPEIHRSSWSTRLGGLVKDGLVEQSGTTRHHPLGLKVLVYRLTDKGREALS